MCGRPRPPSRLRAGPTPEPTDWLLLPRCRSSATTGWTPRRSRPVAAWRRCSWRSSKTSPPSGDPQQPHALQAASAPRRCATAAAPLRLHPGLGRVPRSCPPAALVSVVGMPGNLCGSLSTAVKSRPYAPFSPCRPNRAATPRRAPTSERALGAGNDCAPSGAPLLGGLALAGGVPPEGVARRGHQHPRLVPLHAGALLPRKGVHLPGAVAAELALARHLPLRRCLGSRRRRCKPCTVTQRSQRSQSSCMHGGLARAGAAASRCEAKLPWLQRHLN